MRDLTLEACIAQKTDEPEMVKGRAKSPAGKGKTNLLHGKPKEMRVIIQSHQRHGRGYRLPTRMDSVTRLHTAKGGTWLIADT